MGVVSEPTAAGQAALAEGRWRDAADAFETAAAEHSTGAALHGLGTALWWLGDQRRHVELLTSAYAAYRRAGDDAGAATVALELCCTYQANFGNAAAAGGWVRRAERIVAAAEPGPLRAWVWLMRAYQDASHLSAPELAGRALEAARRDGDVDLELCALSTLGRALVLARRASEGLALIDEAMAGTLAGEWSRPETTVFTSCEMLDACHVAGDTERAVGWCRVADEFTARYGCPYLYTRCRTLYGGVLVRNGQLSAAETELRAALAMSEGAGPAWTAQVLARLADLRLLRGDVEEAEALAARCEGHDVAVLTLAALRLARGEPAVTVALLDRRLRACDDVDPEGPPLLALLVRAQLESGEVAGAETAATRLRALAAERGRADVSAEAALASGRVALAGGDSGAAVAAFEDAVTLFGSCDFPVETARARCELARALAGDRPDLAVVEARAALDCFDRLGALRDADAAASLLRLLGVSGRTGRRGAGGLTDRERQVLDLVGRGYSNPQIASRLYISRKTASHHVSSVLTKLGVRNRAAAAAYASHLGASGPDPPAGSGSGSR
jgi:DNA-binding CsgD family transcriptional regulator